MLFLKSKTGFQCPHHVHRSTQHLWFQDTSLIRNTNHAAGLTTKTLGPKKKKTKRILSTTLPETNGSPLKIGLPNRKVVFQPSIFRGYVSFREGNTSQIYHQNRWRNLLQCVVVKQSQTSLRCGSWRSLRHCTALFLDSANQPGTLNNQFLMVVSIGWWTKIMTIMKNK